STLRTRCGWRRLGINVHSDHEAIASFELISLRTFPVSLNDVGHHDESVVARSTEVFQVLDNDRQVGHALKSFQHNLGSLTTIDRGSGFFFSGCPGNGP